MGCQKKIVEAICSKQADYLIAVKNNQKSLYEQIEHLFTIVKASSEHLSNDIDHGRAEIRKCQVINDLTFLDERKRWKNLNGLVKVETEVTEKWSQKTRTETRYYITNSKAKAKGLNAIIRVHWSVENKLHWVLRGIQ